MAEFEILKIMQHVMGIVYEVLHYQDILDYRKHDVHMAYDVEAALICPQSYIFLRTETHTETEEQHLRAAIVAALELVHGDRAASLPVDEIFELLVRELKNYAYALSKELEEKYGKIEIEPSEQND